jgi:hypothetical protein
VGESSLEGVVLSGVTIEVVPLLGVVVAADEEVGCTHRHLASLNRHFSWVNVEGCKNEIKLESSIPSRELIKEASDLTLVCIEPATVCIELCTLLTESKASSNLVSLSRTWRSEEKHSSQIGLSRTWGGSKVFDEESLDATGVADNDLGVVTHDGPIAFVTEGCDSRGDIGTGALGRDFAPLIDFGVDGLVGMLGGGAEAVSSGLLGCSLAFLEVSCGVTQNLLCFFKGGRLIELDVALEVRSSGSGRFFDAINDIGDSGVCLAACEGLGVDIRKVEESETQVTGTRHLK